jgi:hypothetical protein
MRRAAFRSPVQAVQSNPLTGSHSLTAEASNGDPQWRSADRASMCMGPLSNIELELTSAAVRECHRA